jgi:hypothetical protein
MTIFVQVICYTGLFTSNNGPTSEESSAFNHEYGSWASEPKASTFAHAY